MQFFERKPISQILLAQSATGLRRTLGPGSLIALGIGATVGAGIFTLTGVVAATKAGPALILSFCLAAVGCALAGLCYSEFATLIPVAGSAYTYAYATLGELAAWIIGWDLILEYAVGAATVSIGWSKTLVVLMAEIGVQVPGSLVASPFESLSASSGTRSHGIVNLPAVLIVVFVSSVLMSGIKESTRFNAIIVVLKVTILLVFIALGWKHVVPCNHHPFIPPNTGSFGAFGWSGILSGAGMIFFAYIGFDAVSTAAQETKIPQRDLPVGILGSLLACTVLFVLYTYVLTGLVNYRLLDIAAPLSLAVKQLPYPGLGLWMNLAVLAGLTSVMLVQLLGQSRVFYAMSCDGLLPGLFSVLHPRFHTPWRCNLALMILVGVLAGWLPISVVGAMASIGTLFAFVIVCLGVIVLRSVEPETHRPFRTPFVPALPIIAIVCDLTLMIGLGWATWLRLLIWLAVGLLIYFGFGRRRSRLRPRWPQEAPVSRVDS
jgi:APA family basic amino acid/polyamine antiporter